MVVTRIYLLIILFSLGGIEKTLAEETDQFTLPPSELQDFGPTASSRLFEVLEKIVTKTNSEIQMYQRNAMHSRHAAQQVALRRKDSYLVDLLYRNTGPGFPRWLHFEPLPKYKESRPWKTVYWLAFSQSPLSLIGLSPTINMYGYYFGTDKLGHFFMQGHTYYKIYNYYLAHGKSAKQAHSAIIIYGQIIEQSYLGNLVNGIYSNGDLSANYAGWKFYTNLVNRVEIAGKTVAPILVLNGDKWEFSKEINKETLLKPYLSDNLNEAWNPSRYLFTRTQICRQVKKRCAAWIERRGITKKMVKAKLQEVKHWHGEGYGHWLPESDAVTLNTCFK